MVRSGELLVATGAGLAADDAIDTTVERAEKAAAERREGGPAR